MKNLTLNKKSTVLDFKESKISSKDIATINKFKRLVINEGDNGLRKISKILNEKELKSFKVTKSEFKQSDKFLSDSLKNSILIAYANIKKYHQKQLDGLSISNLETTKGISLWSEFRPINTVGLYTIIVPSVTALTNVCAEPEAAPASPTLHVTVVTPPED